MSSKAILLLAFFEGVTVMLIELLGGKMLIPYFGNSLIIWTSTIGVTMSSLMVGYFFGGILSKHKKSLIILFIFLALVSLWVALMPSLINKIVALFKDSELYVASLFSATLLFALPLILLGACPPILIAQFSAQNKAGISSGKVFAVSTIGSIACALVLGFLVIGKFGVSSPLLVYGLLFFILTTALLWNAFKEKLYFIIIAIPIVLVVLAGFRKKDNTNNYLYISESLQGQLKVFDESPQGPRILQINGVSQTRVFLNPQNPILNNSSWWYVHFDAAIASHKPSGSDVLLMGFGGGSIAQEMVNLGFNLDVVEIDKRLPGIAKDYFFFDATRVNFYIDDARHFIKKQKSKKQYDLVVIDLLHGEVQPNHIFTLEGLEELKSLLKNNGLVVVNYQSNFDEPQKPFLSILKTFVDAKYNAKLFEPMPERPADYIFVASLSELPSSFFDYNHMNDNTINNAFVRSFIKTPKFHSYSPNDNSIIALTDDKPILETMNKESIKTWRQNMVSIMEKNNSKAFK
jgi:spermidine synthase